LTGPVPFEREVQARLIGFELTAEMSFRFTGDELFAISGDAGGLTLAEHSPKGTVHGH
jgi:hypothetical protein